MMLPYITLLGGATTTCGWIGKAAGEKGNTNYGASTTAGGATLVSSTVANSIMDAHYHEVVGRYETTTTSAYVQQLSDEELEEELMKLDMLESDEEEITKVY